MTSDNQTNSTLNLPTRAAVDLRHLISSTLLNQGARPLCIPFALSHAHEAAAGSTDDPPMAPEAIWWHASMLNQVSANGMLLRHAGDALAASGQTSLTAWPWNPGLGAGTEQPPTEVGAPPWKTATLTHLQLAHDGIEDALEDSLAAGRPVVLLVEVTDEFDNATPEGMIDVPDIRSPAGDYHAVVVVGATSHPDRGRLLLIRNSWTEYWGAGGFGWLPIDYLIAHAVQAATVTN